MSIPLLSEPRKVGVRAIYEVNEGDFLRGKIGAWVILDVVPADPRRSRYRYNKRLTIARVERKHLDAPGARVIDWVWDHSSKRRAS